MDKSPENHSPTSLNSQVNPANLEIGTEVMPAVNTVEWLARCAARYVEKVGLSPEDARSAAVACQESWDADDGTPEDAADADLEYWADDEAAV